MPKAMTYKANTVVFFQGDVSDKIYILKSGKVLLKSSDIETGEEIKEMIMTGEFFGVKSALGKYPRDESALVIQNSDLLVFSPTEFEQLVLKNTRIIMKMLKVFSNQLRRIHNQVKNTISQGKMLPPEEGLFTIGEYYFKNGFFTQALYAYERYLTYYPDGDFAPQVNSRLPEAKRLIQSGAQRPPSLSTSPSRAAVPKRPGEGGESSSKFFQAVSMIGQENYRGAIQILGKLIQTQEDPENLARAELEYGKALVLIGRPEEGIKFLTQVIQKYPKHPDIKEGLFFIGKAYQDKGEKTLAKNFFEKILGMSQEAEAIAVKTRKSLRELEGEGV